MEEATKICKTCQVCKQKLVSTKSENDSINKCQNWLENCAIDDSESVCSSDCCSTSDTIFSGSTSDNSAMSSGYVFENNGVTLANTINTCDSNIIDKLFKKNSNKYQNVHIYKSRKVHIGDVTYIKGPIVINQLINDSEKRVLPKTQDTFPIISRRNWLAQPPVAQQVVLDGPAKLVIICHTATEEAFTQADNILLVRLTQSFHIDSRKWDDISYNFLIGSDGNAYEGRGWGIVGAHTIKYNKTSVGISFIGCFLEHLPPLISLEKAKGLIKYGVEIGAIDKNYILVGHCQCRGFASPGKRLFEEIQTWEHWDGTVSVTNPSPLIDSL